MKTLDPAEMVRIIREKGLRSAFTDDVVKLISRIGKKEAIARLQKFMKDFAGKQLALYNARLNQDCCGVSDEELYALGESVADCLWKIMRIEGAIPEVKAPILVDLEEEFGIQFPDIFLKAEVSLPVHTDGTIPDRSEAKVWHYFTIGGIGLERDALARLLDFLDHHKLN